MQLKRKKLLISSIFAVVFALISFYMFFNHEKDIKKILKTSAYNYLSGEAKEYIEFDITLF